MIFRSKFGDIEDNAENRLKETLFIVEATSHEQFSLWLDHSHQSDSRRRKKVQWEQISSGWLVTVGELAGRPCCISTQWARIEGQLIMFWHHCSQVSDSVQTEKWLEKHFNGKWDRETRRATIDAQNFHWCLDAIEEANQKNGK